MISSDKKREHHYDVRSALARTELKDKIKNKERERRKREKLEAKERIVQYKNSADGADACKVNDRLNDPTLHFYDQHANAKDHDDIFAVFGEADSPSKNSKGLGSMVFPKDLDLNKKLFNNSNIALTPENVPHKSHMGTSAGRSMFRLFTQKPDPTINDSVLKDRFADDIHEGMDKGPSKENPFHRTDEHELEKFKDDDSDKEQEEDRGPKSLFGGLFGSTPGTTPPRTVELQEEGSLLVSPDKKIVVNKERYLKSAAKATKPTETLSSSHFSAAITRGASFLNSTSFGSRPGSTAVISRSPSPDSQAGARKKKKKKAMTAEEKKQQQIKDDEWEDLQKFHAKYQLNVMVGLEAVIDTATKRKDPKIKKPLQNTSLKLRMTEEILGDAPVKASAADGYVPPLSVDEHDDFEHDFHSTNLDTLITKPPDSFTSPEASKSVKSPISSAESGAGPIWGVSPPKRSSSNKLGANTNSVKAPQFSSSLSRLSSKPPPLDLSFTSNKEVPTTTLSTPTYSSTVANTLKGAASNLSRKISFKRIPPARIAEGEEELEVSPPPAAAAAPWSSFTQSFSSKQAIKFSPGASNEQNAPAASGVKSTTLSTGTIPEDGPGDGSFCDKEDEGLGFVSNFSSALKSAASMSMKAVNKVSGRNSPSVFGEGTPESDRLQATPKSMKKLVSFSEERVVHNELGSINVSPIEREPDHEPKSFLSSFGTAFRSSPTPVEDKLDVDDSGFLSLSTKNLSKLQGDQGSSLCKNTSTKMKLNKQVTHVTHDHGIDAEFHRSVKGKMGKSIPIMSPKKEIHAASIPMHAQSQDQLQSLKVEEPVDAVGKLQGKRKMSRSLLLQNMQNRYAAGNGDVDFGVDGTELTTSVAREGYEQGYDIDDGEQMSAFNRDKYAASYEEVGISGRGMSEDEGLVDDDQFNASGLLNLTGMQEGDGASRGGSVNSSYSQQLLAISCPNMVKVITEEEVKKKVARCRAADHSVASMTSMFSSNTSLTSDFGELDLDDNPVFSASMKNTARNTFSADSSAGMGQIPSSPGYIGLGQVTTLPNINKPNFTRSLQLQLNGEMSQSQVAMRTKLRKQSIRSDVTSEYDAESVYAYSEHMAGGTGITPKNANRPPKSTNAFILPSAQTAPSINYSKSNGISLPSIGTNNPNTQSADGRRYKLSEGLDMFNVADDATQGGNSLFPNGISFSEDVAAASNHNSSDYAKLQNKSFRNSTARNALHARLHARYSADTEGEFHKQVRVSEKAKSDATHDVNVHDEFAQEIKGSLIPKSYF